MPSGIHHVAFACRDAAVTHRFYAEALELPLLHTELSRLENGWFRHFFYGLGDGSALAFFELHGVGERVPLETAISTGGYVGEGVAGYLYLDELPGTVPIVRMFHYGLADHFYTSRADEVQRAIAKGYVVEGVLGYVLADAPSWELPG